MSTAKQKMSQVIQNQPDDATYAEILKELAFEKMIIKGCKDSNNGDVISNQKMQQKISSWKK